MSNAVPQRAPAAVKAKLATPAKLMAGNQVDVALLCDLFDLDPDEKGLIDPAIVDHFWVNQMGINVSHRLEQFERWRLFEWAGKELKLFRLTPIAAATIDDLQRLGMVIKSSDGRIVPAKSIASKSLRSERSTPRIPPSQQASEDYQPPRRNWPKTDPREDDDVLSRAAVPQAEENFGELEDVESARPKPKKPKGRFRKD